jgi:hypothetical protein
VKAVHIKNNNENEVIELSEAIEKKDIHIEKQPDQMK